MAVQIFLVRVIISVFFALCALIFTPSANLFAVQHADEDFRIPTWPHTPLKLGSAVDYRDFTRNREIVMQHGEDVGEIRDGAATVTVNVRVVTETKHLDELNGMDLSVKASFLVGNINAGVAFSEREISDEETLVGVIELIAVYPAVRLDGYKLTEKAEDVLRTHGFNRFTELYGTHFISQENRETVFRARFSMQEKNLDARKEFRASAGGGYMGVELKAKFFHELSTALTNNEATIDASSMGGGDQVWAAHIIGFALMKRPAAIGEAAKGFAAALPGQLTPVSFVATPYSRVPGFNELAAGANAVMIDEASRDAWVEAKEAVNRGRAALEKFPADGPHLKRLNAIRRWLDIFDRDLLDLYRNEIVHGVKVEVPQFPIGNVVDLVNGLDLISDSSEFLLQQEEGRFVSIGGQGLDLSLAGPDNATAFLLRNVDGRPDVPSSSEVDLITAREHRVVGRFVVMNQDQQDQQNVQYDQPLLFQQGGKFLAVNGAGKLDCNAAEGNGAILKAIRLPGAREGIWERLNELSAAVESLNANRAKVATRRFHDKFNVGRAYEWQNRENLSLDVNVAKGDVLFVIINVTVSGTQTQFGAGAVGPVVAEPELFQTEPGPEIRHRRTITITQFFRANDDGIVRVFPSVKPIYENQECRMENGVLTVVNLGKPN